MKSTLTLIIASLLAPLASAAQWDYPATSDKVLNEAQALAFVEKYYHKWASQHCIIAKPACLVPITILT